MEAWSKDILVQSNARDFNELSNALLEELNVSLTGSSAVFNVQDLTDL